MPLRAITVPILATLLWGCQNGTDNSGPPPTQVTPTPSPTPAPTPTPSTGTGQGIVNSAGGTISLAGDATVNVPSGAFTKSNEVTISKIMTKSRSELDFGAVTSLLKVSDLSLDSFQVIFSSEQPKSQIKITLKSDVKFTSGLSSSFAAFALAETENAATDEGPYPTWDLIPVTVDTANSTITFDARPIFFAAQDSQGKFRGTFTIVASPKNP